MKDQSDITTNQALNNVAVALWAEGAKVPYCRSNDDVKTHPAACRIMKKLFFTWKNALDELAKGINQKCVRNFQREAAIVSEWSMVGVSVLNAYRQQL